MNIFVGNLHFKVQEEDLRKIFEEYGDIVSIKVISDNMTGRSKGFGFVEMSNDEEANRAIEELNEGELMGRKIVVNQARPKTSGGGGGGGFNRERSRSGGGDRGGDRGGYNSRRY